MWLWDLGKRILLLAVVVLFLVAGQYWLDRPRQEPEALGRLQYALNARRQICNRLYNRLLQAREEWKSTPFYRMDRKLLNEAEIQYLETLLREAHADFAAARNALADARLKTGSSAADIWERYALHALLTGIMLLFILPFSLKVIMFYGVARLAEYCPPVRRKADAGGDAPIRMLSGGTSLELPLAPGSVLFLRSGDWGKRRAGVTARTRFMWSWKYPLVSLASGMCELVELRPEPGQDARITVTSPEADIFVAALRLDGGQLVIRPRYLAGISGELQLQTRWSFHLHDLLAGRVRQIILSGTGTVIVTGVWGVEASCPEEGRDWRIEEDLLLGFSADAEYALCRTETFWHYFRGRTALFDRRIQKGIFLTQNNRWSSRKAGSSSLERLVNGLLNAAGSLLGF